MPGYFALQSTQVFPATQQLDFHRATGRREVIVALPGFDARQDMPPTRDNLAAIAAALSRRRRSAIMDRLSQAARPTPPLWEVTMPAYIMLANWTDQGARQVKDSPKRVDAAKKALVEMGGEFKAFYMTMGDYDLIIAYEAPDDAVAARFTLLLGMMGTVRTKTLKAFPEMAYREIINSLG
jgi:uncharacterized protein with GYD domain